MGIVIAFMKKSQIKPIVDQVLNSMFEGAWLDLIFCEIATNVHW